MPILPGEFGHRFEELARGTEKKVLIDRKDPDKKYVYAKMIDSKGRPEWYLGANFVKSQFYFKKIVHSLFPNNVPEMHMASTQDGPVYVSKRVEMDSDHKKLTELRYGSSKTEEGDALDVEAKMGVEIGLEVKDFREKISEKLGLVDNIDGMIQNYGKDANGNLVYVDNFIPWGLTNEGPDGEIFEDEKVILNFNVEKIRESISKIEDKIKRRLAELSLDQIILHANSEAKKYNTTVYNL